MNYDEWWEDFVAEHDDWKYADSEALRRAAFQAGAASRDAEIAEYKQDAERYRFIRDNPWNGTDLEGVIICHMNSVWDLSIDEAIRARGDTK